MKKPTILRLLPVLALTVLMLTGCKSANDMVENGNYDAAIALAQRKLAGKKKKKAELVDALENAFHRANARDMGRIEQLKASNRPEHWPKIVDNYRRIADRQRKLEPLLPLVDEHGLQASFRFVRVAPLIAEAKKNAADYYYESALAEMNFARQGDKAAARKAYNLILSTDKYLKNYRQSVQLKREAESLGVVHVLVDAKNSAAVVVPRDFERELLRISVRELDSRWKRFYLRAQDGIDYDYKVVMNVYDIDVTPELIEERSYIDEREIEDGFDYVLDQNGNVTKDSLGNDIKVPRRVIVRAEVLEMRQSKVAKVDARLDFVDLKAREVIDSYPLSAEAVFENFAATFNGDERALSSESKVCIGKRPVPFPATESLLLDAAEQLKPHLKRKMANSRILI